MSTIYIPKARIYAPNDPFFEEGNITLRALWLKKQAESEFEADMIQKEATELSMPFNIKPIHCDICRIFFPTISAFELHYEAIHRNKCSSCHKVFPGAEWLKLHIDEIHNVLLRMMKERGDKIYKCFVKDCPRQFSKPFTRRLHLIYKHHYPEYFPFDLVYTGTLTFKQMQKKNLKNRLKRDQIAAGDTMDIDHNKKPIVKKKTSNADMEMDELVTKMTKLKIPKHISFGHQAPGREARSYRYNTRSQKKQENIHNMDKNNENISGDFPSSSDGGDAAMMTVAEEKKKPPRKRGPKKKRSITTVTAEENNMDLV